MGHLSSLSRTGRWMLHSLPGLPWEQEGLRETMGSAQTLRPPQTPRSRGTGQEEHHSPGLQQPPQQAAQENCRRHTRSCHLSPPSYGTAPPPPHYCGAQAPALHFAEASAFLQQQITRQILPEGMTWWGLGPLLPPPLQARLLHTPHPKVGA